MSKHRSIKDTEQTVKDLKGQTAIITVGGF